LVAIPTARSGSELIRPFLERMIDQPVLTQA
jgi:hypothetical protein